MNARDIFATLILRVFDEYSADTAKGALMILQFARAQPEYSMALLAALESEFEASRHGMELPDVIRNLYRDFPRDNPIEVLA